MKKFLWVGLHLKNEGKRKFRQLRVCGSPSAPVQWGEREREGFFLLYVERGVYLKWFKKARDLKKHRCSGAAVNRGKVHILCLREYFIGNYKH